MAEKASGRIRGWRDKGAAATRQAGRLAQEETTERQRQADVAAQQAQAEQQGVIQQSKESRLAWNPPAPTSRIAPNWRLPASYMQAQKNAPPMIGLGQFQRPQTTTEQSLFNAIMSVFGGQRGIASNAEAMASIRRQATGAAAEEGPLPHFADNINYVKGVNVRGVGGQSHVYPYLGPGMMLPPPATPITTSGGYGYGRRRRGGGGGGGGNTYTVNQQQANPWGDYISRRTPTFWNI